MPLSASWYVTPSSAACSRIENSSEACCSLSWMYAQYSTAPTPSASVEIPAPRKIDSAMS
ncbi:MAG: hypothetical protein ACTHU0_27620 [Kofleriaceae bacterium]